MTKFSEEIKFICKKSAFVIVQIFKECEVGVIMP